VNFLLHHAFASAETGSPVAGVGAMLPDLWRMAHPRVRARSRATMGPARAEDGHDAPRAARGAEDELARGVAHHLAIDAWFHATEAFGEGERRLAARLRALEVPKLALFAHAGWELCLDGAWVRRGDPTRALAQGFAAAGDAIDGAADGHGAERLDSDERARFAARVRALREGLVAGPWVRAYGSAEGLVELVEGMRTRRLGLAPLHAPARVRLAAIFGDLEADADAALDRLLGARPR
jgi:hypothetical protein